MLFVSRKIAGGLQVMHTRHLEDKDEGWFEAFAMRLPDSGVLSS